MRFKNHRWRRGEPESTGVYLVFDRGRGRIEVVNVLASHPLQYRTRTGACRAAWPYAAFLGPLTSPEHVTV